MKLYQCLVWILMGVCCVFAETVPLPVSLEINPVFQQKLKGFEAFYNEQIEKNPDMPEEKFNFHVSEFLKNSGLAGGALIVQLAIAHENEAAWQHKLLVWVLFGNALKQLTSQEIVAQVAPYYELSMDNGLRKILDGILYRVCIPNSPSQPDYGPILAYVKPSKGAPPAQLVRYMFKLNPEKALPEVQKLYGNPDVQTRDLQTAANGEWWEQVYAAEKMKQDPKLRDLELIKQLKVSKHAVVRETIQEIESEQKAGHQDKPQK